MERVGLVEAVTGQRETASGYAITRLSATMAESFGVSTSSLIRTVPRERLVRTFTPRAKPEWDYFTRTLKKCRGDEILIHSTAQTEAWTEALATYNAFISSQQLAVLHADGTERAWIDSLNDNDDLAGARYKRPEILRTDLYRVFNNDSMEYPAFKFGGRLVGAWWMSVPGEVRPHITINGEPTVELDYSACHPRMLYHELGDACPTDPYELPEVSAFAVSQGLDADVYRDSIKWVMQVIINGRGRIGQAKQPTGLELPAAFTRQELSRMLQDRHAPIASVFNTGAGMRLMKDESDIALAIVSTATQQGWPVLPVHDSFIAAQSKEDQLRQLMDSEYLKIKKFNPTIK